MSLVSAPRDRRRVTGRSRRIARPVEGRQGRVAPLPALLLAVGAAVLMPSPAAAGGAERYAYLFLQGRIVDDDGGRPAVGLSVRVSAGTDVFESVTDQRGVFVFEKLPVAPYDLRIISPGGRVMRSIRRIDDPSRIRLRVRTGRGEGTSLRVLPDSGRVAVDIPDPPPSWNRFWKEFGIVLATVGVFAL